MSSRGSYERRSSENARIYSKHFRDWNKPERFYNDTTNAATSLVQELFAQLQNERVNEDGLQSWKNGVERILTSIGELRKQDLFLASKMKQELARLDIPIPERPRPPASSSSSSSSSNSSTTSSSSANSSSSSGSSSSSSTDPLAKKAKELEKEIEGTMKDLKTVSSSSSPQSWPTWEALLHAATLFYLRKLEDFAYREDDLFDEIDERTGRRQEEATERQIGEKRTSEKKTEISNSTNSSNLCMVTGICSKRRWQSAKRSKISLPKKRKTKKTWKKRKWKRQTRKKWPTQTLPPWEGREGVCLYQSTVQEILKHYRELEGNFEALEQDLKASGNFDLGIFWMTK